ncbi:hypothetical protein BZARG_771 [Bizionia argentinensis JUB59]|uniref:Uncharacterized protein n=1 Tax=Bizionia argentinensis JUB59 TaxID=1046627 RepID=G2EB88_9FLAO|nr:hypothetical protein BZARG_771 [Bizionia argentinensis JUB59]
MDPIIKSIQDRIDTLPGVKYVDEDWGQLDYYSPNFPVQWPCVLIDISGGQFDNIGRDRAANPVNRQTADATVSLTFANLKLTNSSGRAPQAQKDLAFSIWKLQEDVHALVHGWKPAENTGALIRRGFTRVKRDDGVQEYTVRYNMSMANV